MHVEFSERHLQNVKETLFGLQKQANVTNGAVVKIVARELYNAVGLSDSTSPTDVDAAIMSYLEKVIPATVEFTDDALMLIAGEQSLANRNSGSPCVPYHRQLSDTSPKMIYRITVLGEDAEIDNGGDSNTTPSFKPSVVEVAPDAHSNADFYTKARQLKDAILPSVPDAVKAEIPDNEWAQVLVCAQGYFEYHS